MAKIKKNTFVEGTLFAFAAIVVSKLLGVLYSIPFYNIIGDEGGVLYSLVYNIYTIFLDISTCGIPVAVSIVISEYSSLKLYNTERKAYRTALKMVTVLALVSFTLLQVFAKPLSAYMLKDMTDGVSVDSVATGVRIISLCILVAPFLSVRRGFIQGHKYVSTSSSSQVIEQLVRICIVLLGSYLAIRVFNLGTDTGVYTAFAAAVIGACASFVYIAVRSRGVKFSEGVSAPNDDATTKQLVKKILFYCIPIVMVSVAQSVYSVVDMKLILYGLHSLGMPDTDVQLIASVASTWVPRICMIVTALPLGIISAIAPFTAASNALGNNKETNDKLEQALGILLLVTVPLGLGMMIFAEPIYRLFYGYNAYGPSILVLGIVLNMIAGVGTVVSMTMQSIGHGKTVVKGTLLGIVINTIMDLPFIYFFDYVGIPPYLGAATSSILGYSVMVIYLMRSLKRTNGFTFKNVDRLLKHISVPTVVMLLFVIAFKLIWPVVDSRGVLFVVQLGLYALLGIIVYFPLCDMSRAFILLFGEDGIYKILKRVHLYNLYSRVMFLPALWAGKLFLWLYKKRGNVQDDHPGMVSARICPEFLRYVKKPALTICVTGTNGKSTISAMTAKILEMQGKTVAFNDWGANHHAGHARCLLDAVNIFNRSTKDAAVVEMDELISVDNIPRLKPQYFIINNVGRDSMLRNANPEYVRDHLRISGEGTDGMTVIVCADDPLCSSIAEGRDRALFGVCDMHTNPLPNLVNEFPICPECGAKIEYEYRNYRDIGRAYCPECGRRSPEPDYLVTAVNKETREAVVKTPDGEYSFKIGSVSIYNIYNMAAVITLFLRMGVEPETLREYMSNVKVPRSRETDCTVNGINVYTRLAKGQNVAASSSVFENVSKSEGIKDIVLVLDEVYEDPRKSETAAWIFDTDYEFLNRDNIHRIIVGGERYLDHKVRLLMAGIPREKIICVRDPFDTPKYVDVNGIDSIYVMHDVNFVSRGHKIRDLIVERIEQEGGR